MRTYHVEARAMSTASPSEVYALLIDRPTWPSWSPIDTFELERPGHPDRQGLGSIGILRTDKHAMHEQIVELVTDRRMSYVLLSGLALRNYRANVDLEPSDGGTAIRWASSFNPKVPGTGRTYQKALTKAINNFATGLAMAATRSVTPR